MVVAGTETLARDLESLLDSEQGEMLTSASDFFRTRVKRFAMTFFVGIIVGYPLAGMALTWLLGQASLVPNDVSIVVLQPLEVVILQLRLASHFAVLLVVLTVTFEASLLAARSEQFKAQLKGVELSNVSSFSSVILALLCAILLGIAGIWYVVDFLLPILLEYLQADAAAIGATTTWQLAAWIGFIASLCLGAAIGFQVPLVTLISLRGGLVERDMLTQCRRHFWFAGFCVGAMLSPPDPLSMFLVAGPMLILFEVALILDRIFG